VVRARAGVCSGALVWPAQNGSGNAAVTAQVYSALLAARSARHAAAQLPRQAGEGGAAVV